MNELHRYIFDIESFPDKFNDWISLAHWVYHEYHKPEYNSPDNRLNKVVFDIFLPGYDNGYPENSVMTLEGVPNITIHYLKDYSATEIIPLFLYHQVVSQIFWDTHHNITTGNRELILAIRDMREKAKTIHKKIEPRIYCRYLKRGYCNWLDLDYCIQEGKLLETHPDEYTNPEKFSWNGDEEDPYIRNNGYTIMIAAGSTRLIQKFVEALSLKIKAKCDWSFCGGRAHIEVLPEYVMHARGLITNPSYMSQFIKEYPYDNENERDYFQILSIM